MFNSRSIHLNANIEKPDLNEGFICVINLSNRLKL